MPIERNPQNTLKPKLASNRTANTPLTPRLAVAPSTASAAASQSGRSVRSNTATTPRVKAAVIEDVTPVKAFLSSNVTPRSSSRKSRVGGDSASSTPSGTPTSTPGPSRPASTIDVQPKEQSGGYNGTSYSALGVGNKGARPRSTPGNSGPQLAPAFRPPLTSNHNSMPAGAGPAKGPTSPLFFHASDARPQEREQLRPQKKAATFFYADGKQDEPAQRPRISPALSTAGRSQPESKFFHADSVSDGRNLQPNLVPSPRSMSPEPLDPSLAHGRNARSPSPTKDHAHLSYRKGASQVMRPSMVSRNSALSILSGTNTPDLPDRSSRRSSVASYVMRGTHGKSASLSSIDSVTDPRNAPLNEPVISAPSPLNTESRIASMGSLADSMASAPSPPSQTYSAFPSPGAASPQKRNSTQTALETMNELAANARRERKVLDLEISNSSLLAINRSLEKEVRKQKAELRRFRRMSRAGRFMTDGASANLDNSPFHGTSHVGELSDMSEGEEGSRLDDPEEEEEDEESSDDTSFDEGQLSPSAQLERDEAHRLGDEKRLQLDLSKHRDLLLDSQKMNQSLKRCMNWTEQLIKDGQKALQYQVRPSDVKLGGRVLIVEDEHEEETQAGESRGLLSPWSPLHRPTEELDALDSPFFANAMERIVDRDSGVDVDDRNSIASTAPLGSPFEERIKRLQESIEALS